MSYQRIIPNNIPIDIVLKDFGVELFGSGETLNGISPFRPDAKKTSFTVSISKNIFHDWKLGICGGPVKFIETLLNLNKEQAEKLLIKKYLYNKEIKFSQLPKKVGRKPKYGSPEEIDKAYNLFLSLSSLSDTDKDYLLSRGLTLEEIEKAGFKSFPKRTIKKNLKKLFDENEIDFKKIPGFFQYKGDDQFTFPYFAGILIPMRNSFGLISGLQIRKTQLKNEDDSRYTWFSSSFANVDSNNQKVQYEYDGLGPKNICHSELVDNPLADALFITEGFFKAYAIKRKLNIPSLSIQGVSNWKPCIQEIEEMTILYPNIKKIVIALDADFIYNINVSKAISDIGKEILKKFPNIEVFHLRWNPKYKGIDDLFEGIDDLELLKKSMRKNKIEIFIKAFEEFYPIGKEIVKKTSDKEVFKEEFKKVLIKNNFK